jgi:hypothetical protein
MPEWQEASGPTPYTGPYFEVLLWSGGRRAGLGKYINVVYDACSDYYHGKGKQTQMVKCMLNNLDLDAAANSASHTYLLTLWPALISIIVAAGHNGDAIAYDNLLWSGIFAMTSGAVSGFDRSSQPHHFETVTMHEARHICEYWEDDALNVRKSSRRGKLRGGRYVSETTILALGFFCTVTWVGFVTWYLITLRRTLYYSNSLPWANGALWYLLAAIPTLCKGVLKMGLNNVELWEPVLDQNELMSSRLLRMPSHLDEGTVPKTATTTEQQEDGDTVNTSSVALFARQPSRNGFHTWGRIAYLQLAQQQYRILVKPDEPLWINMLLHYCFHVAQMSLFVWGCMVQGGILFMATPTDYGLTALLVFATASPRLIWPYIWSQGRSGADLVVWYKPAF